MVTTNQIESWFRKERDPLMSSQACVEYMHLLHPRAIFIKTLKRNAKILDMGAGDGSLAIFRNWPQPVRSDLQMFAFSLEKGANFDSYDRYELGDWERNPPLFDGMSFDAIFASHFIEHVSDPLAFVRWAAQRLTDDGRLYLEWPSQKATSLPPRDDVIGKGINIIISNFYDDHTHRDIPKTNSVIRQIEKCRLEVDQQGIIRFPFFEDEVLAHFAKDNADPAAVQLAFWSKYRWSQYVIASKKESYHGSVLLRTWLKLRGTHWQGTSRG